MCKEREWALVQTEKDGEKGGNGDEGREYRRMRERGARTRKRRNDQARSLHAKTGNTHTNPLFRRLFRPPTNQKPRKPCVLVAATPATSMILVVQLRIRAVSNEKQHSRSRTVFCDIAYAFFFQLSAKKTPLPVAAAAGETM